MTKLEIPEGYSKGTYEVRESAFPCGYLVNAQDGFTVPTAQLIMLAPAMAEEIKRLREIIDKHPAIARLKMVEAENKTLRDMIEDFKGEIEALQGEKSLLLNDKEIQRRRADNLKSELEALRRSPATREERLWQVYLFALDAYDTDPKVAWNWAVARVDYGMAMLAALAKPQGAQEKPSPYTHIEGVGGVILTESKPVTRRPFDLEAALRGEKVVTRDGREIESVSRNPEGSEYALTCVINGCSDYWHGDGSYVEGRTHRSDLFMEGGV